MALLSGRRAILNDNGMFLGASRFVFAIRPWIDLRPILREADFWEIGGRHETAVDRVVSASQHVPTNASPASFRLSTCA